MVRHELQRRVSGTGDWVTVVTVAAGEEADFVLENADVGGAINYVDDGELLRGSYDYQFLAYDDADLSAGSEIISLRPYDSGVRGEIQDLDLRFACTDSTYISVVSEAVAQNMRNLFLAYQENGGLTPEQRKETIRALEISGLITAADFDALTALDAAAFYRKIKAYYEANQPVKRRTNCRSVLTWSYPIDATILHFQILRSRKGSRLRPYKALPLAHFFTGALPSGRQLLQFEDRDAEVGVRYVYKVMVMHVDGGYSREGGGVTVVGE